MFTHTIQTNWLPFVPSFIHSFVHLSKKNKKKTTTRKYFANQPLLGFQLNWKKKTRKKNSTKKISALNTQTTTTTKCAVNLMNRPAWLTVKHCKQPSKQPANQPASQSINLYEFVSLSVSMTESCHEWRRAVLVVVCVVCLHTHD